MWLKEKQFVIKIGGNLFIDQPNPICFRDGPLFDVYRQEDGYLGIDFDIYNSKGKRVASVRKNNLYGRDKSLYEVQGSADRLTLTDKQSGAVILDIRKRTEAIQAELDISLTTFLPDGRLLDLSPEGCNVANVAWISGSVFKGNAKGGINIV